MSLLDILPKHLLVLLVSGAPLREVLSQTDPVRLINSEWEGLANWSIAMDDNRWVSVLIAYPRFARHCPWDELDYDHLILLLRHTPSFISHIPIERIHHREWEMLIDLHPSLIKYVDLDVIPTKLIRKWTKQGLLRQPQVDVVL